MTKPDPYVYAATIIRVIDGDTVLADIDLGFYMTCRTPVRLAHINAPELNAPGGKEAKQHLHWLLEDINTGKFYPVTLFTFKPRDKYGRFLAEIISNDKDINVEMVEDGHAVAYEGGTR